MKLNEYQKIQIIGLVLSLLFLGMMYGGIYIKNFPLICASFFVGIVSFIYFIYHMEDISYYQAKLLSKKIKKEYLESPIKLRELFVGKGLFKLAKRYGVKKAILMNLILSSFLIIILLLIIFYFIGWPTEICNVVAYILIFLLFTYYYQTKIVEESMRHIEKEEEDEP